MLLRRQPRAEIFSLEERHPSPRARCNDLILEQHFALNRVFGNCDSDQGRVFRYETEYARPLRDEEGRDRPPVDGNNLLGRYRTGVKWHPFYPRRRSVVVSGCFPCDHKQRQSRLIVRSAVLMSNSDVATLILPRGHSLARLLGVTYLLASHHFLKVAPQPGK
jgi:hypothetical protein